LSLSVAEVERAGWKAEVRKCGCLYKFSDDVTNERPVTQGSLRENGGYGFSVKSVGVLSPLAYGVRRQVKHIGDRSHLAFSRPQFRKHDQASWCLETCLLKSVPVHESSDVGSCSLAACI
jgi:hypothetical protein